MNVDGASIEFQVFRMFDGRVKIDIGATNEDGKEARIHLIIEDEDVRIMIAALTGILKESV